ncbi:MAG: hypothetical protein U9N76_06600 [Candidatus Marinimicrobia bacterium]|nr:hypothetical protein [Candidatus Neomarinimicrobiota bacterium]
MSKRSNLIFNIEKKDFIKLTTNNSIGKYLKILIKRSQVKENSDLFFNGDVFEQITEDEDFFINLSNPNSLFLLNMDEEKSKEIENNFGYICISKESIYKRIPFFFNYNQVDIQRDSTIKSWEFISKFKHPFNSIIINDPYILKEPDKIKENLISLLENILPPKLNKNNIFLTIITDCSDTSYCYNRVIKELKDSNIDLSNFTLINSKKEHNRNIITNYLWISSDYGFTLFNKNKVAKSTPVRFVPITFINDAYSDYNSEPINRIENETSIYDSYLNLLKKYKGIIEGASDNGVLVQFKGSKKNRLIKF